MEGTMRRIVLVLVAMALAMMLTSGVALAVNKVGTNGPNLLRGTDEGDNLLGRGGQDDLFGKAGSDNLVGGSGRDNVIGGSERLPGGGDKNLAGGPGNDLVLPGLGSDNALGEEGNDLLAEPSFREALEDTYSGGPGDDVFLASNRPASGDIVTCGRGLDRVLADRKDTVVGDCERVYFDISDAEVLQQKVPGSFFQGLPPNPFA
jgi:Ca2+-binding RTX toxin-like protein